MAFSPRNHWNLSRRIPLLSSQQQKTWLLMQNGFIPPVINEWGLLAILGNGFYPPHTIRFIPRERGLSVWKKTERRVLWILRETL